MKRNINIHVLSTEGARNLIFNHWLKTLSICVLKITLWLSQCGYPGSKTSWLITSANLRTLTTGVLVQTFFGGSALYGALLQLTGLQLGITPNVLHLIPASGILAVRPWMLLPKIGRGETTGYGATLSFAKHKGL